MKVIEYFAGLFLGIFFLFALVCDVQEQKQIQAERVKRDYERFMQFAVHDAVTALVETQNNEELEILHTVDLKNAKDININKEKALEAFYNTFFTNLGIDDNIGKQNEFIMHVPLKMILDYDRYYISAFQNNQEVWIPKFYQYYDKSGVIIYYTLNDYVYTYNTKSGGWIEGSRKEIYGNYPTIDALKEENFEEFKRLNIITALRKDMKNQINNFNEIAKRYGFVYDLNIPEFDDDLWQKTLNGISFIAFIQGYPIYGVNDFYSTYGFSTYELIKKNVYCGKVIDGTKYYYRKKVDEVEMGEVVFKSDIDAVKKGYYPYLEGLNPNY